MQLTYQNEQDTPIGYEGQLIESYPNGIVTGIAEAGVVNVGVVVIFDQTAGRADKSVVVVSATGEVTNRPGVVGVTMLDPTYPQPPYRQFSTFPVMRKGRALLFTESAIAKGANPFVRFAANGGNTILGKCRGDADTGAVVAAYITAITPAAAGGLFVAEINL